MAQLKDVEIKVRFVPGPELEEVRKQAKRVERAASNLARSIGQLETILELHDIDGIELVVVPGDE